MLTNICYVKKYRTISKFIFPPKRKSGYNEKKLLASLKLIQECSSYFTKRQVRKSLPIDYG